VRAEAIHKGIGATAIAKLGDIDSCFGDLGREIERARGGDADAAEKARRLLLEIDATLAEVDTALAWPVLDARVRDKIAWATSWLAEFGTDDERKVLRETVVAMEKAKVARDSGEVERQLSIAQRLGWAAYYRSPRAWEEQFEHAASSIETSSNLRRAAELVREGKKALASRDPRGLEDATRGLWKLMPADTEQRQRSYSSGVR
jgi:molecular chaperone DnaK